MHDSAVEHGSLFRQKYVDVLLFKLEPLRVLDVGSMNVNGSLRPLFPDSIYVGLDLEEGQGVNLLMKDGRTPTKSHSFDVVVSSSALEHAEFSGKPSWRWPGFAHQMA